MIITYVRNNMYKYAMIYYLVKAHIHKLLKPKTILEIYRFHVKILSFRINELLRTSIQLQLQSSQKTCELGLGHLGIPLHKFLRQMKRCRPR